MFGTADALLVIMSQATQTFEILLGKNNEMTTIRDTKEGMLKMLAERGLMAVKRGYTTWVVYENKMRCGSVQELS